MTKLTKLTKKNKKVKTIDEKIKMVEKSASELDYTKGLQAGIKTYRIIKRDIDEITKELTAMDNDFKNVHVEVYSDEADISDEQFATNLNIISEFMAKIKECANINEKIDMYYDIFRLIEICKRYQENIKLQIVKLDA